MPAALDDARCTRSDIDQVLLVGGMTRMPAVRRRRRAIFGKPPRKDVNPDEIVAMGAAVHSGIMGGELHEVALLDVTPYALGVRVKDGRMVDRDPEKLCDPHQGNAARHHTKISIVGR